MIVAHITDTHILPKGQAWLGKQETNTSARLALVVEHLNKLNPRPTALLITGDTIEKGGKDAYQHLKELLTPLTIPFYIIPGNHDDREEMRTAFVDTSYMPRDSFIQYVVDEYPVRLVALDTHVPGADYGLLCQERLRWLEEVLKDNPSKPTLLFMHHFPVKVGQKCFEDISCQMEGDFEKLVHASPQILGVVAGHYHKMCVSLFGGKMCVVAPSVAPSHYFAADEDKHVTAIDLVCPSFVLHRWGGGSQMTSEAFQAVEADKRLLRE